MFSLSDESLQASTVHKSTQGCAARKVCQDLTVAIQPVTSSPLQCEHELHAALQILQQVRSTALKLCTLKRWA